MKIGSKQLLTAAGALALLALPTQATLIGLYDFDAGSLADTSGNGNDAVVSEGAFPGSAALFTNGAVSDPDRGDVFDLTGGGVGGDGSNGGLNLNLPVAGNSTGSWTVALWIRENDFAGSAYLFDNRNTATGAPVDGARMILSPGQGTGSVGPKAWNGDGGAGGGWIDGGGTVDVTDGDWHHVAWVFDGTNFTAYTDGVAGISGGTPAAFPDLLLEDIEIGNEGTGGGQGGQEDRLVDEIRVYSSALTDAEILDIFNGGGSSLPGDTDGDNDVDDSDLGTSFANYTGPVGAAGGKTTAEGDTDGDGDVDDSDLGSSFAAYTGPLGPAAVPEPTSLALIGLGGLLAVRRRRA